MKYAMENYDVDEMSDLIDRCMKDEFIEDPNLFWNNIACSHSAQQM